MLVTPNFVRENLPTAVSILKEVYPQFKYQDFWNIKVGHSRSSWGTIYLSERGFRLTISNCFNEIKDENKAYNKFMSTLIHELIHTIPGCWDHKYKFQVVADLVNAKYPHFNICRATSMRDFGINKQRRDYSWVVYCSDCNQTYKYRRQPKYSDCIKLCRCGRCKSHNLNCMPIDKFRMISNIAI